MVLAAGRGQRLRPLTDTTPKPLLAVHGKPLIVHHLLALARAGIREVAINLSWLGEQLRFALGDGHQWGVQIHYSEEGPVALETGGGIIKALPWLGEAPFIVVSGDIYTDFDFARLRLPAGSLAHLVMVPNPQFHPGGDFSLEAGRITEAATARCTYGNIGLFHPDFFHGCVPERLPLLPLLRRALAAGQLTGELYAGRWANVGTPEELAALQ
jgi:MurNAc alpha-1-phosphate uridylyltransferase